MSIFGLDRRQVQLAEARIYRQTQLLGHRRGAGSISEGWGLGDASSGALQIDKKKNVGNRSALDRGPCGSSC